MYYEHVFECLVNVMHCLMISPSPASICTHVKLKAMVWCGVVCWLLACFIIVMMMLHCSRLTRSKFLFFCCDSCARFYMEKNIEMFMKMIVLNVVAFDVTIWMDYPCIITQTVRENPQNKNEC